MHQYRVTLRKIDSLKTYNDQLERLTAKQLETTESLSDQINSIAETQQNIVPFLLRMIKVLWPAPVTSPPVKLDIIQLAQTYLYLQLPLKAAIILNSELDNGKIDSSKANIELLSNSWLLAHDEEQAALILERYVSKFNDASLYYKLGHIYIQLENWSKAKSVLETVVTDKNFKDHNLQATAWLLLGISSYHEKDTYRSTQALNKALNFKETKDHAKWWLNQIEEESLKDQGNDA